jgi:TctA family transporter
VLGDLLERNFTLAVRLYELGTVRFWERPLTWGLLALIVATLYWMRRGAARPASSEGPRA